MARYFNKEGEESFMKSTAFVTGADRGLGLAMCSQLLEKGWVVFSGQYMPEWPDLSALAAQYPQTLHIVPSDFIRLVNHPMNRTVNQMASYTLCVTSFSAAPNLLFLHVSLPAYCESANIFTRKPCLLRG